MPNPWPNCRGLPPHVSAALAALHLKEPYLDGLRGLGDSAWRDTLQYCDKSRITLALQGPAAQVMPAWVRERVGGSAARNAERMRRIHALYGEIARQLDTVRIDFLVLKGITHAALFRGAAETRVQYDIDLFVPPPGVYGARDALTTLGFEAVGGVEDLPTDHLPTMIRKTDWEWRGDYFDIDIPVPVELHYQFWSEAIERLRVPGTEEFWPRRTSRNLAGVDVAMLRPVDALAYAALHLLKHVLRGSAHPYHIYEIAHFLDALVDDNGFWHEWRSVHSPELRRLETVAFRLAQEWFGCGVAPALEEEMRRLPGPAQSWFREFATSPARSEFDANKDELWLHWSLLDSRRDAWEIARRRLVPKRLPLLAKPTYVPEHRRTWRRRLRRWGQSAGYLAARAWHHSRALPRTLLSGTRWWWRTRRAA